METDGSTLDRDGYSISLRGDTPIPVSIDEIMSFDGLPAGSYAIAITGIAANCSLAGDGARTIDVSSSETVTTVFSVSCTFALRDQIVFIRNPFGSDREIYVVNEDGSGLMNLTNDPARYGSPAISPDGTRIAFGNAASGQGDIFVTAADWTQLVNLTNSPTNELSPAWSPDGAHIAFIRIQDLIRNIWVMRTDGSEQRQLTSDPSFTFKGSLAWSPDGSTILYHVSSGFRDVLAINANGGTPVNLTDHQSVDLSPAWSPDGSKIAFSSNRGGSGDDIWIMNPDGSDATQVTFNHNNNGFPSWSPDGHHIAFSGFEANGGGWQIFSVDVRTGEVDLLVGAPDQDVSPNWSRLR